MVNKCPYVADERPPGLSNRPRDGFSIKKVLKTGRLVTNAMYISSGL